MMTPERARAILRKLGLSQANLSRILTAARSDGRRTTPAVVSNQLDNIGANPALALLLSTWEKAPAMAPKAEMAEHCLESMVN